jgi:hypothetical protein
LGTELKLKVTPSQEKVVGIDAVFGKYVRIIVGEGGEGGGE